MRRRVEPLILCPTPRSTQPALISGLSPQYLDVKLDADAAASQSQGADCSSRSATPFVPRSLRLTGPDCSSRSVTRFCRINSSFRHSLLPDCSSRSRHSLRSFRSLDSQVRSAHSAEARSMLFGRQLRILRSAAAARSRCNRSMRRQDLRRRIRVRRPARLTSVSRTLLGPQPQLVDVLAVGGGSAALAVQSPLRRRRYVAARSATQG